MNTRSLLQFVLSFCVVAGATSALADEVKVQLAGTQEVPPVATTATGSGTIVVHRDMTVGGRIVTSGVVGTMAHIHVGKAGTNGPVAIALSRNGDNGWLVPPGAKLTEAQYQAYEAGDLYVNVHSDAHKGGEIRGQISPPPTGAMSPPSGY